MGTEIDRLEIEVEVQASKANKQLDLMIDKLTKVATALTGVNPGKLGGIGSSFNSAATGAASTSSYL